MTLACESTPKVDTRKVPEVFPAAIVHVLEVVATELLLVVSETEIPPAGAGDAIDTVPVELAPEMTVVGLSFRLASGCGLPRVKFVDVADPVFPAASVATADRR